MILGLILHGCSIVDHVEEHTISEVLDRNDSRAGMTPLPRYQMHATASRRYD